eukprot:c14029_g1_i1.p1 GENE.c14029_g1_i1~~c14029_g1_i1.p1  ORF type:complete len:152 (-),score=45.24 c14029_g1_i1:24-452(-)
MSNVDLARQLIEYSDNRKIKLSYQGNMRVRMWMHTQPHPTRLAVFRQGITWVDGVAVGCRLHELVKLQFDDFACSALPLCAMRDAYLAAGAKPLTMKRFQLKNLKLAKETIEAVVPLIQRMTLLKVLDLSCELNCVNFFKKS